MKIIVNIILHMNSMVLHIQAHPIHGRDDEGIEHCLDD